MTGACRQNPATSPNTAPAQEPAHLGWGVAARRVHAGSTTEVQSSAATASATSADSR